MLGQDPYHNGHAHGLAFSSLDNTTPASLRTIFKEIARDVLKITSVEEFKAAFPSNDLTPWAEQGVLLMNTILTVQPGIAKSCQGWGWEKFTDAVLQQLILSTDPVVFVLWGKDAQRAYDHALMTIPRMQVSNHHLILRTAHPATASYGKDGFTGCGHFSMINNWLVSQGREAIEWRTSGTKRVWIS